MAMVEAWIFVIMDNGGSAGSETSASAGIREHSGMWVVMVVAAFIVRLVMDTGSGSWLPPL